MVIVVLRDDDVAHRLLRDRLDMFQQFARVCRVVAGVHEDDSFGGHDGHRVRVVQLADVGIDVLGELAKLGLIARDCGG